MGEALITRKGGGGALKGTVTDISSKVSTDHDLQLATLPIDANKVYIAAAYFDVSGNDTVAPSVALVVNGVLVKTFFCEDTGDGFSVSGGLLYMDHRPSSTDFEAYELS